jgi:trehalose synthase
VKNLAEVVVGSIDPQRFRETLDADRYAEFEKAVARAQRIFDGTTVWNVNSTARGGGVAEMLRSLLAYARGAQIEVRWVVVPGTPQFFRITKRLHNNLHGATGDAGGLGTEEANIYSQALAPSVDEFTSMVKPHDVVIVHDPQPAPLVAPLKEAGATVLWRCHVGIDYPNEVARRAWNFLHPHVEPADKYIFSRRAFAWEALDEDKIHVVPPSIDAFSPKNQELEQDVVRSILATAGVAAGEATVEPSFAFEDGSPGRVQRRAVMIEEEIAPAEADVVVQVSRWDRLKDPLGVITAFVEYIAPESEAHLILAGPSVEAVADDPEGADVLAECTAHRQSVSPEVRRRIHLACLPMEDGSENAAIVNALQRHATVVIQKSIAEGFGLTVAEAMWKARPVVASRIGGIQDQIVDGVSGVLVDPEDLEACGRAVAGLLADPGRASSMGKEAQERVRDEFLGARHLMQYLEIIAPLLAKK